MIRMKVTGEKELHAKFGQIEDKMYEALAAGLLAGAMPVINAAKDKAPYKTGNLKRSIHLGTKTENITEPQATDGAPQSMKSGVVKKLATLLRSFGLAEVLAGTDVVYAAVQEFLYKAYLRPALDENRDAVMADTGRAVKMALKALTV